jgi:hypothetical protein
LEEITGVEKERYDLETGDVPSPSKFCTALRRIAFFIESSSIVDEPSAATVCLALRLESGVNTVAGLGEGGGV